jgi:adenylate cyclase
MGQDEEATLRTLTFHRRLIDSQIEQHHGRFVDSAGDSVLAEFASVVEAVNCAVEIQTGLKAENASLAPERRMEFRIGVNLGDVMVDGEQIYGAAPGTPSPHRESSAVWRQRPSPVLRAAPRDGATLSSRRS